MNIDYNRYTNYVSEICDNNDLTSFKQNHNYQYMLEHVNYEQGLKYLNCIRCNSSISEDSIKSFCALNDSIGNPSKLSYGSLSCSPSSLRYIYHAHLILKHFQSFNLPSYKLIELGGGYGGLCLAIHQFAPDYNISIESYTIVDLPSPLRLQQKYLSFMPIQSKLSFVNSETFGKDISDSGLFLISNYCFSEISAEFQRNYIKNLFPKVSHGFMAWNMINTYAFGFDFKEEDEDPKTGQYNKYVYF